MAGLCRSIIENVFTKVIRLSNLDRLGDTIVVQGGTFRNDAVLRAMEQYTGRKVTRAPYPEIMGAIGAALLTKEQARNAPRSFHRAGCTGRFLLHAASERPLPLLRQPLQTNGPDLFKRKSWVTNNRCERGEILGNPQDAGVRARLQQINQAQRPDRSVRFTEKAAVPALSPPQPLRCPRNHNRPAACALFLGYHAVLANLLFCTRFYSPAIGFQHPQDV